MEDDKVGLGEVVCREIDPTADVGKVMDGGKVADEGEESRC